MVYRKIGTKLRDFKQDRSSLELERAKILFQYTSISIFAIFSGFLLFGKTPSLFLWERAEQHFALPFFHCATMSEIAFELFRYCIGDLMLLWGIFFSTLSRFPYFFSNLVLFYQGLCGGFLIAAFFGIARIPYGNQVFLLTFLRILLFLLFFFYSIRIAEYSKEAQRQSKQFWGKFFLTVIIFVMIIASNVIYCGLIYLI